MVKLAKGRHDFFLNRPLRRFHVRRSRFSQLRRHGDVRRMLPFFSRGQASAPSRRHQDNDRRADRRRLLRQRARGRAVDEHEARRRRAGRPRAARNDAGREAEARLRLLRRGPGAEELQAPAAVPRPVGRFRLRRAAPGHSQPVGNRRGPRRGEPGGAERPPCDRAALRPEHGRHVGRRHGVCGRRDDRGGGPRLRLQRAAGGRRQPDARAAQRPQFRVRRRGSAAGRPHRRRADQGHPG